MTFDHITVEGKKVDVRWKKWIGKLTQGYAKGGLYESGFAARPRITVMTGQTKNGQRASLMHELLHHCIALSETKFKKQDEEAFCDAVDSWLTLILRENPQVVEFLTEVP